MKVVMATVLCVCAIAFYARGQENRQSETAERTWARLQEIAAVEFNSGHFANALDGFTAALSLAATPEERAITLDGIGCALSGVGRNVEAVAQFEQALAGWRSIDAGGRDAMRTAVSLANTQRAMDRYADSERTLRAALEARPHDNDSLATVLDALGGLLNQQYRLAEARESFKAALKLSPRPGENRVNALLGLADVGRSMRDWHRGIDRLKEALSISRDIKNTMLEARALQVLGITYSDMGNPASAEPLLRRALKMFDETPVGRSRYATALVSLGIVYEQEGKRALAEDALMRSLRGDSPADSRSTTALELLAVLLATEKRCQEAADFANRAGRIIQSTFGENSPPHASALATVAFVEEHAGDLENAEHHYSQALRILRAHKLLDSSAGLDVMTQYAIVLRKLHRGREAKSVNAELARFRQAVQLPH